MSGDLLGEPTGRTTTKKWLIGAVALALIAGLGVGLGVGLGLQAKRASVAQQDVESVRMLSADDGAPGAVPHRSLRFRAARSRPSIVLVGDGLTESGFSYNLGGWGSKLVGSYARKADLINRGFGGYFTNYFVDYMLDSLFDVTNPIMGIAFLGVKDSQVKQAAGKAYVSPEKFFENVDAIMSKGNEQGIRHWLLITPPPVVETPGKPGARSLANSQLYVDQLQALGRKHNATVLDIFTTWQRVPDWQTKFINADKLHLGPGGNDKLFNDVLNTIKAQIPEMDPVKMPWQFPSMTDIDHENPGLAFADLEK